MIHLIRTAAPDYLQSEKVLGEKARLLDQFNDPARQGRLRFDAAVVRIAKESLLALSGSKCAYCETPLGQTEQMNINAFRPRDGARDFNNKYFPDHYWWLAYEWENLLPSCSLCSHNKRDWFPIEGERAAIGTVGSELSAEKAVLLDPCTDAPENHLQFLKTGHIQPLTDRGRVTLEILGLNRPYLVEERKVAWRDMQARVGVLTSALEAREKAGEALAPYIRELLSPFPKQAYAATRRAALQEWIARKPAYWAAISATDPGLPNEERVVLKPAPVPEKEKKSVQRVEKQLSTLKRFSIKRIEIRNFKNLSALDLNVMPPYEQELHESWLLLLGDNGVGKSSILQAIALALAGEQYIEQLAIKPTDILQRGKRKGWVKVYSHEHPEPIELHFDRKSITGSAKQSPTFLLGYGSTRLLPKGNIKPEKSPNRYAKIRNLFDYSVALNPVESWLTSLKEDRFNHRVAPALFDLLALKQGEKLTLSKGKLFIRQFKEEFALEDISDGYKNIIALASDIMQTVSIDQASFHATQGIVLIDELGNHLHPRWRMKIVDSLRRTFPNLQFIVTTHEPLCLRGLAHGEVTVLVRDKAQEIQALDSRVLPDHNLLRVDQLLTSDLFGLIDTMAPEVEKTYEEYYALLSKDHRTADEEAVVQSYRSQLAEKQVLGSTPQQQVYYQLIEETYAKSMREEGFIPFRVIIRKFIKWATKGKSWRPKVWMKKSGKATFIAISKSTSA